MKNKQKQYESELQINNTLESAKFSNYHMCYIQICLTETTLLSKHINFL